MANEGELIFGCREANYTLLQRSLLGLIGVYRVFHHIVAISEAHKCSLFDDV